MGPCKWYEVCPIKRYCDRGLLDTRWKDGYCLGEWNTCVRYEMEEKGIPHPDWMLPDGSIEERLRNQ